MKRENHHHSALADAVAEPPAGGGHTRWPALVPNLLAVALVNLIPIAGVLWLGWDAFTVVFAYWMEGAVIGLFTLLKIIWALPVYDPTPGKSVTYERKNKDVSASFTLTQASKATIIPKFIGIYGGLMLFYAIFLVLFLGGDRTIDAAAARLKGAFPALLTMLAAMILWHTCGFYSDFIRGPAWARSDPMFHFARPFGRFILLHLLIVFGSIITFAFSLPWSYLGLFILLKSLGDMMSAIIASAGPWRRVDAG